MGVCRISYRGAEYQWIRACTGAPRGAAVPRVAHSAMIVNRTVELQWFDLRSLRCVPPWEQLRHGGRPHRRGSIDILHPCKRSCIPPGSLAVLQGFHQNPCSTARDFGVPIWGTPAPPSEIDDFPGAPLLGPPGSASDFKGAGTPHGESNVEL